MIFHSVDYIIIAVVGLSVLTGLFRGFVKESIALVVWVVAIWAAYTYAALVANWLQPYIDDSAVRTAAGFVMILLIVLLLGGILNAVLSFILHRTGLSGTDRLLGMLFGFVRGVFIVALVIVVLNMTSLAKKEDYANHSFLYTKFDPLVNWLSSMMPSFIKQAQFFDKESSLSQDPSKEQVLNPK
jgi:membrane protein required for colicin V production